MERIGIAASKIAKGNLLLYNFFVVLLTSLFALLIFFVSGSSIVIVLVGIAYGTSTGFLPDLQRGWIPFMIVCLQCLAIVVGILALWVIARNIKFHKKRR
ncbi:MAG TPA: hypothetical protein PL155_04845 [Candidatus Omnitrophota bacterium]|nr:hypothetical protein [Candidatus Omnitrophota bacterium]HPD84194.1 hypothetical protein [Candidatus Omnitrophota bacterium]HRZ03050.1 hypothetical protein [Candidatus Omnitrophota bacterium]